MLRYSPSHQAVPIQLVLRRQRTQPLYLLGQATHHDEKRICMLLAQPRERREK
ncbi:MAG TPA: hypothetical protein VE282_04270 [Gemmatimonadales bacterium]|nr:hypothetical protein [Gemmatimonadales bacterium]